MNRVKTAFVRCVEFNLMEAIREKLQAVNSVSDQSATRIVMSDELFLTLDEQHKREVSGLSFLGTRIVWEHAELTEIFGLKIVVDSDLEPGSFIISTEPVVMGEVYVR